MINDKRVLVVVPARGGSKGIPLKNLAKVCGETLIAHTAKIVKQLDFVDRAVVSTDHQDIIDEALKCGLDIRLRPTELSGDLISDLQVLTHALGTTELFDDVIYDVIVMLQPTCPLRTTAHVTHTAHRLIAGGFDSVWTVSAIPLHYHPLKQLWMGPQGQLSYLTGAGAEVIARQQLTPNYCRNGAAYAFTRECLLVQQTIMGKRSGAVLIDEPLVNIDTPEDLAEAERMMMGRGEA